MATALDMIAALRALNAPPALGRFSAATSTPYLSPGIGSGGGNMLVMKDPQGVAAANSAWRDALEQSQGGGYQGMVFGDSIGGAQNAILNLRQQNISRALQQAALQAQQQARQDALRQQREYREEAMALGRQNALLADRRARDIAESQMGYNYDALNERANSNRLQYLAKLAEAQSRAGIRQATENAQSVAAKRLAEIMGQRERLAQLGSMSVDQENDLLNALTGRARAASARHNVPMFFDESTGLPTFDDAMPKLAAMAEQEMWGEDRARYNNLIGGRKKLDYEQNSLDKLLQILQQQYGNPAVNFAQPNAFVQDSMPTGGWAWDPRTQSAVRQ